MVVPENVALAAYRRDPEDRGVVEAWVESGGDANGRWDAADHGGPTNVHVFIRDEEMRGDPLLLMTVYGTTLDDQNEERDCRDRLELIRYLLSRGADPSGAAADGTTALHMLPDDSRSAYRLTVARLLIDAGANLEPVSQGLRERDRIAQEARLSLDVHDGEGAACNSGIHALRLAPSRDVD